MRLATTTIKNAFHRHGEVYVRSKGWEIPHHLECWDRARRAFDDEVFAEFEWLYLELKNRWQVFRGASGPVWKPEKVFNHLHSLEPEWRIHQLSELNDGNIQGCWNVIESLSGIKSMKSAPSVVAISKFLHFWNPRLFVIVDDAIMWNWVLAHGWLRDQIKQERDRIQTLLPDVQCALATPACDLLSYLAVLSWSAEVVRINPGIVSAFTAHVQAHSDQSGIEKLLVTYEAAAVEWLLLGLVALPPAGVDLNRPS